MTTSSKVTAAVLDKRCPNLSSGLPMMIFPPVGRVISLHTARCGSELEGSTGGAGIIKQAMKLPVGFPTLQKTVNCEAYDALVMKHLLPLRTYVPSGLFLMNVVMAELSEPAPGSVRQKEAMTGFSTKGLKKRDLCSSVPCWAITVFARSLHIADVEIPVSP